MNIDLFMELKKINGIKKVSNVSPEIIENGSLNFVFFLCPKISGYRLNKAKTGLTTTFQEGVRESTLERIKMVQDFLDEFKPLGVPYDIRAIIATKEAIILFPIPLGEPKTPSQVSGIHIISDYGLLLQDLERFGALYKSEPWKNIPQRYVEQQRSFLADILSKDLPENIVSDFIDRVLAQYALEGLWFQEKKFGNNPVVLGVETQATMVLQNAALPKECWIPSIQLK